MKNKQKLRIESDGTGAGTIVTVGGTIVDKVRSLKIEFPSRQERATVTIVCEPDIVIDADMSWNGGIHPAQEAGGSALIKLAPNVLTVDGPVHDPDPATDAEQVDVPRRRRRMFADIGQNDEPGPRDGAIEVARDAAIDAMGESLAAHRHEPSPVAVVPDTDTSEEA